jgi:thioesterase domain-containing protein
LYCPYFINSFLKNLNTRPDSISVMPMSGTSLREEVECFLQEKIPLTRAMGVRVAEIKPLTIEAPVALNLNHLQTAFGGSINAVATLAAYAFLWLELRAPSAYVVVSESSIKFRRPVVENIRAICLSPDDAELSALKATLAANGRARIRLQVLVKENGETAAEFEGEFVAIRPLKL